MQEKVGDGSARAGAGADEQPMSARNGQPRVVFMPSGLRGQVARGTTVLAAARALGVDLDSVCGGRALCGRCQIMVSEGEFAKLGVVSAAANLSGAGATEIAFANRRRLDRGRRLGCQAHIQGDLVIDVPASSQVHKQVVRKRPDARKIEVAPSIRLHYLDLKDGNPSWADVAGALQEQWGINGVAGAGGVTVTAEGGVTVAIRDNRDLVQIWPGFRDAAFGVAIDLGSTTIAAHLTDLATGEVVAAAGAMNPQIRFGEDVMSRVSYVMMNPGGAADLTDTVRRALAALCAETAAEAGIGAADILDVTIVGNPIMHHLLLGFDAVPLGQMPFDLHTDEAVIMAATGLGLALAPGAQVYVLPCIAGHVGADTAGVILSEAPHKAEATTLVVDVGTNAEIVLGNKDRLVACSSPTGPAFEGAQVSSGQRAAPGAIERVRITRDSLRARYKIIGCDLWSDELGFEDAARATGVTGICGSGIIEALAEMFLSGVLLADGTINGALSETGGPVITDGRTFAYVLREAADGQAAIMVTQNDVRAIQLAKAALYAGTRLLMDRLGLDAVSHIRLAGAFGSHIDTKYAMVLGLIPDCRLDNVSAAGNAAGTGARIALVNKDARAEIEALVRRVEKIETALEPAFQAHFVDAMAIPHARDAFPELAKVVNLPARPAAGVIHGKRPRRRKS